MRIARGINRLQHRRGKVFAGRYGEHILKTPRETRNALVYVINNYRRHLAEESTIAPLRSNEVDPLSSGPHFDGWLSEPINSTRAGTAHSNRARDGPLLCRPARTWLLTTGWRRHGEIEFDAIPGIHRSRLRRSSAQHSWAPA